MQIEIKYRGGRLYINGTPTKEEKKYFDKVVEKSGAFYKATEKLVEELAKSGLESIIDIKIGKKKR